MTEILKCAKSHGATEVGSGEINGEAGVTFAIGGRRVQISIKMPQPTDPDMVKKAQGKNWGPPPTDKFRATCQAEERRRWRCLLLAIKAKLEAVASGISTFEEEFLAHIVTSSGLTIIQELRRIERGGGPKLLGEVQP